MLSYSDLKIKAYPELKTLFLDAKKEQMTFRFRLKAGGVSQTNPVRQNRRFLARLLTRMNEINVKK